MNYKIDHVMTPINTITTVYVFILRPEVFVLTFLSQALCCHPRRVTAHHAAQSPSGYQDVIHHILVHDCGVLNTVATNMTGKPVTAYLIR
jgi:hypothetical protein